VTDTFGGLIRDVGKDYCNKNIMGDAKLRLSITGRIGIENMVHDFINMTLFANLQGKHGRRQGPPTLVTRSNSRR